MKNVMKEAHKLTNEIKKEFPNVDYKFQLGICIAYLSENKGEAEMSKVDELKTLAENRMKGQTTAECKIELRLWEKGDYSRTYINIFVGKKQLDFFINNKNCNVINNEGVVGNSMMRDIRDLAEKFIKENAAELKLK